MAYLTDGSRQHLITAFWEYLLLLEVTYKVLEKDRITHKHNHEIYQMYVDLESTYKAENFSTQGDFSERLLMLSGRIAAEYRSRFGEAANTKLTADDVTSLVYSHDIRLLRERLVGDACRFPFKDDQFSYDLLGNRLTDQAQTTTAPWQYNANNELLNSGLNLYAYNENGSTIEKKAPNEQIEQRYLYNSEERLSEVRDANDTTIASYYYDPFGRRLWKTVAPNQPGNDSASPKTTYLYYTDEGYAAEYTHAGNHPNSEATIAPQLHQLYLFAPQGLWSTEPLAIKQTGDTAGWRYPETDHLGTPHGLISKTGEETTDLRANAFGQTEVNGEPLPLRFAGQTEDDEAGNIYNLTRTYTQKNGRYASIDLTGIKDGPNLYIYVHSRPLKAFDPLGLEAWCGCWNGSVGPCGTCPDPPNPYPDEPDDTTICQYYTGVANSVGCRYHEFAFHTCNGDGANYGYNYAAVVFLNECTRFFKGYGTNGGQRNCIRRCLVREDEVARADPACSTGPGECPGSGCVSKLCINSYHYSCFEECGSSWKCFGGHFNWYPGDDE